MRLLVLLGLVLAMAGSTVTYAQDVDLRRYYPLGIGDTWIYSYVESDCEGKDCVIYTDVLVRRTVVGEMVIDDETNAAVEVDVLSPESGNVLCTSTYGARVNTFEWNGTTEAVVDIIDVEPPCDNAFIPGVDGVHMEEVRSIANGTPSLQTWQISGIDYDLMVRGERFYPDLREVDIAFARDVGLLVVWSTLNIGSFRSHNFRLWYAEVGGVMYGLPPVASEPSAPASGSLAIDLHPNPTRGPLTLRVTGTTAKTAVVEVFDVLGRRVLRRDLGTQPAESEYRLDLADAPAGLYIVRLSSDSESATQRLVKAK